MPGMPGKYRRGQLREVVSADGLSRLVLDRREYFTDYYDANWGAIRVRQNAYMRRRREAKRLETATKGGLPCGNSLPSS